MTGSLRYLFIILVLVFPFRGRTGAISWNEIISGNFEPRREQASYQIYLNHIKQIQSRNITPEAAILEDIFHIRAGQDSVATETPDYRLTINSFPYWLEPNIVHLLVFSNSPDWNREELSQATIKTLSEQLPGLFEGCRYQYVIHINMPNNRTVRGLAHTHVFIRNREQADQVFDLIKKLPFSKPDLIPSSWKRKINSQP